MSFITSQTRCDNCGYTINVAFGIVGMTMMGDGGPDICPVCKVGRMKHYAPDWDGRNPRKTEEPKKTPEWPK